MKGREGNHGLVLLLAAAAQGCVGPEVSPASAPGERVEAGAAPGTAAGAAAGAGTGTAAQAGAAAGAGTGAVAGAAAGTGTAVMGTAAQADAVTGTAAQAGAEANVLVGCREDADCGYDPVGDRCGSDPRYNRQPPIVDQGIICYCEAERCALLRVLPVPCEGDSDCAVRADPRAHPVRASEAQPHEVGRACRDFMISTRCERTNICTMHRHRCEGGMAGRRGEAKPTKRSAAGSGRP